MLTIHKVPTVVSNYQEEAAESGGCGRNCLGKCCLPVSRLPIYAFEEDEADTGEKPEKAFLHNLLLGQWEDRMIRGLFRYDVTSCEAKIIHGHFGFIAQLNEGRHLKKRPSEFRIDRVLQPFDVSKFNFTRVGQEEVLFRFQRSSDNRRPLYSGSTERDDVSREDEEEEAANVVAINVSPIEYGHVLLIPRVLDCLPQRIDEGSLLLAMYLAREAASPFFRVGYNSLGAFATINHLHFQAYYMEMAFPVERASTRGITTARKRVNEEEDGGVVIRETVDYPVRGLVFDCGTSVVRHLGETVAGCCVFLQENNIAYNLLIADRGRKVFLFPQCYAEKQALGRVRKELLETQVNPAVWEIGGHIVLKRREDFEKASEDYAVSLLAEASLSEKRFGEVKGSLLRRIGLQCDCVLIEEDDDVAAAMAVRLPPLPQGFRRQAVQSL